MAEIKVSKQHANTTTNKISGKQLRKMRNLSDKPSENLKFDVRTGKFANFTGTAIDTELGIAANPVAIRTPNKNPPDLNLTLARGASPPSTLIAPPFSLQKMFVCTVPCSANFSQIRHITVVRTCHCTILAHLENFRGILRKTHGSQSGVLGGFQRTFAQTWPKNPSAPFLAMQFTLWAQINCFNDNCLSTQRQKKCTDQEKKATCNNCAPNTSENTTARGVLRHAVLRFYTGNQNHRNRVCKNKKQNWNRLNLHLF